MEHMAGEMMVIAQGPRHMRPPDDEEATEG